MLAKNHIKSKKVDWTLEDRKCVNSSFKLFLSYRRLQGDSRRRKRQGFEPWVGKISWRRAWQPTPVFLLGESNALGSLVGYNP